jgi:hypothetical protein
MSKFALKPIKFVSDTKLMFYELVLNPTEDLKDKGQLTEFENELEQRYRSELRQIYAVMEFDANMNHPPPGKLKELSGASDGVKEYEYRSKHLRIYCIKTPNGKTVILGGLKSNQTKDLRKFRALKNQYLNTLK